MKVRTLVVVAALLAFAYCASDNNKNTNATGNWEATLTNSVTDHQSLTFSFNMNQSGRMLNMSSVSFQNADNCFGAGSVMSGQSMDSGIMAGMQMQMSIDMWSNSDHTGNHLTMQMGMPTGSNNQMNGTYTLTGAMGGCESQTGTAMMSRMM